MDKPTSESLAAVIVSNRVLGLCPDEAKSCMSELMRRREDEQDPFEFEKFIEDQIRIVDENNEKSRANNGLATLLASLSSMGKIL
jgi:hypothetical protein